MQKKEDKEENRLPCSPGESQAYGNHWAKQPKEQGHSER